MGETEVGDARDELVDRAAGGDLAVWEALAREHRGLVEYVIMRRARRCDEVEDLVSETFLKAMLNVNHVRERGRFAAWLARIATNVALDWGQGRQQADQLVQRVDLSPDGHAEQPDDVVEARELAGALKRALAKLPPEWRMHVILHDLEGYTHGEIGRAMGCSTSASKWRTYHAYESLRQELAKVGVTSP